MNIKLRRIRTVVLFSVGLAMAMPAQAKFLQTDPVGYQDQMNLYAYCSNDPMNCTDPSGQSGLFNLPLAAASLPDRTLVEIKAYKIGRNSAAGSVDGKQNTGGKFGHSFVQYTDLQSGTSNITDAFPTDTSGNYATGSLFGNGTLLGAQNTIEADSPDTGRGGKTFDSVLVFQDFNSVSGKANDLVDAVNAADVPYAGSSKGGDNSNNFSGHAFKDLTGRTAVNDSGLLLPGLKERLDDRLD